MSVVETGWVGPLSQNPSPALSSPWPPSPWLPHPGPSRALPTLPQPPLPPGLGLPPHSHGGLDFGHAGMRPPPCLSRLLSRGPAGAHVGRGAFHPPSSLPSLGLLPCGALSVSLACALFPLLQCLPPSGHLSRSLRPHSYSGSYCGASLTVRLLPQFSHSRPQCPRWTDVERKLWQRPVCTEKRNGCLSVHESVNKRPGCQPRAGPVLRESPGSPGKTRLVCRMGGRRWGAKVAGVGHGVQGSRQGQGRDRAQAREQRVQRRPCVPVENGSASRARAGFGHTLQAETEARREAPGTQGGGVADEVTVQPAIRAVCLRPGSRCRQVL